jgi:hypothetical protein
MKLTINAATGAVQAWVPGTLVQKSSGFNYLYVYGLSPGKTVLATFERSDATQMGPYQLVYGLDDVNAVCYLARLPEPALNLSGELSVYLTVDSTTSVYAVGDQLFTEAIMSVGHLQDSMQFTPIAVDPATYRFYSMIGGVKSYKVSAYEDGGTLLNETTYEVNETCSQDEKGYYRDHVIPTGTDYVKITIYDLATNNFSVISAQFAFVKRGDLTTTTVRQALVGVSATVIANRSLVVP